MDNIEEKKNKTSDAQLRAVRKYDKENSLNFAFKYTRKDIEDGLRLKGYLEKNGLKANAYIKELIKKDLDSKGYKGESK